MLCCPVASTNPRHNYLPTQSCSLSGTHCKTTLSYCSNMSLRRANYGNRELIFVCCNILVGCARVLTNGMSFCGLKGCDSRSIHSEHTAPLIFCSPQQQQTRALLLNEDRMRSESVLPCWKVADAQTQPNHLQHNNQTVSVTLKQLSRAHASWSPSCTAPAQ